MGVVVWTCPDALVHTPPVEKHAAGSFLRIRDLAFLPGEDINSAPSICPIERFRRSASADAPFLVPLYPLLPLLFAGVYAALFVGTALEQPALAALTIGLLVAVYGLSWTVRERR